MMLKHVLLVSLFSLGSRDLRRSLLWCSGFQAASELARCARSDRWGGLTEPPARRFNDANPTFAAGKQGNQVVSFG